jgi:transglutaminase-like putative cysteine protease
MRWSTLQKDTRFVAYHQSSKHFMPLGLPQQPVLSGKQQAKSALRLAPFEGWFVLVLLGIALYCVVASIIAVGWVSSGSWLLLPPVAGILIGLVVAKMPHFPQFILHVGACLVGHWLSVWLSAIAFQVSWTMVLATLRMAFTGQFMSLGPPATEIAFFFYLSFLCFFLGYFGSWLVYRAHLPWLVALVYVSIMLVNLNSARQDMSYLIIVMVAALLLLIARMQLVIQVAKWKHEGLHTDRQWLESVIKRCMQGASIIVAITLVLSWFLPIRGQNSNGKAFWNHLDTAWTDAVNGHLSLQDLNALVTPNDGSNFFGDQLTVSNTVHLPTGEVLRYQITDGQNSPYYLEGFTFDTFDGHTWTSSLDATRTVLYGENDRLLADTAMQDGREERIKVSITSPPNETKNYIFAPANPRLFSVPTVVYYDGEVKRSGGRTAGAWTQQKPLSAQETYETAFVPPPSPNASGSVLSFLGGKADRHAYDGLTAQYFQVPTNISPRVQERAIAWTAGSTDVYTALKSLETHLNDTSAFTYSLDNQPVPDNTDIISWLLQTRQGYCTYYATAMSIMARMLGIPTRMVNGFSQGVYDAGSGQFVVNGNDAHSWVQAFFPNYGWINFDPTPTFAPNASPQMQPQKNPIPLPSPTPEPTVTAQATAPASSTNQQKISAPPPASSGGNSMLWIVIPLMGVFLVIALLLVAIVRYWWGNLYRSSPLISAMYWRFCRIASFFGMAPHIWQTPHEYGHMIGQRFPQHAHTFSRLTDLFVREHWGGPQQAVQGLNEAEVKDLSLSLSSLFVHFLTYKFRRKPPA